VCYWLNKHPVRYTARLQLAFNVRLLPKYLASTTQLKRSQTTELANIIARMPNLKMLDVFLSIRCYDYGIQGMGRVFALLSVLRDRISERTRLRVHVSTYLIFGTATKLELNRRIKAHLVNKNFELLEDGFSICDPHSARASRLPFPQIPMVWEL